VVRNQTDVVEHRNGVKIQKNMSFGSKGVH
jgi:hypothetical protein